MYDRLLLPTEMSVDIDLTVVGSKNRSGEYRRLLGSVAQRVVKMADRSVTVVKTPVASE